MDYNEIANFVQAEGDSYIYELRLEDYLEMNTVEPEAAMEMMLKRIVEAIREKAKEQDEKIAVGTSTPYPFSNIK